jgi:hypothetical protein
MKLNFVLLVLIGLFSCGDKEAQLPENILSQNKMQQVIWDMTRSDELVNYQASMDTSINRKEKSVALYEQVFRIHKISEQDFRQSLAWYQKNPSQLKVVLDSVRNRSERLLPLQYSKP